MLRNIQGHVSRESRPLVAQEVGVSYGISDVRVPTDNLTTEARLRLIRAIPQGMCVLDGILNATSNPYAGTQIEAHYNAFHVAELKVRCVLKIAHIKCNHCLKLGKLHIEYRQFLEDAPRPELDTALPPPTFHMTRTIVTIFALRGVGEEWIQVVDESSKKHVRHVSPFPDLMRRPQTCAGRVWAISRRLRNALVHALNGNQAWRPAQPVDPDQVPLACSINRANEHLYRGACRVANCTQTAGRHWHPVNTALQNAARRIAERKQRQDAAAAIERGRQAATRKAVPKDGEGKRTKWRECRATTAQTTEETIIRRCLTKIHTHTEQVECHGCHRTGHRFFECPRPQVGALTDGEFDLLNVAPEEHVVAGAPMPQVLAQIEQEEAEVQNDVKNMHEEERLVRLHPAGQPQERATLELADFMHVQGPEEEPEVLRIHPLVRQHPAPEPEQGGDVELPEPRAPPVEEEDEEVPAYNWVDGWPVEDDEEPRYQEAPVDDPVLMQLHHWRHDPGVGNLDDDAIDDFGVFADLVFPPDVGPLDPVPPEDPPEAPLDVEPEPPVEPDEPLPPPPDDPPPQPRLETAMANIFVVDEGCGKLGWLAGLKTKLADALTVTTFFGLIDNPMKHITPGDRLPGTSAETTLSGPTRVQFGRLLGVFKRVFKPQPDAVLRLLDSVSLVSVYRGEVYTQLFLEVVNSDALTGRYATTLMGGPNGSITINSSFIQWLVSILEQRVAAARREHEGSYPSQDTINNTLLFAYNERLRRELHSHRGTSTKVARAVPLNSSLAPTHVEAAQFQ